MSKKELKALDSMLARYQQFVDSKYALSPAFELAVQLRRYIEKDITGES